MGIKLNRPENLGQEYRIYACASLFSKALGDGTTPISKSLTAAPLLLGYYHKMVRGLVKRLTTIYTMVRKEGETKSYEADLFRLAEVLKASLEPFHVLVSEKQIVNLLKLSQIELANAINSCDTKASPYYVAKERIGLVIGRSTRAVSNYIKAAKEEEAFLRSVGIEDEHDTAALFIQKVTGVSSDAAKCMLDQNPEDLFLSGYEPSDDHFYA